ncbi:c-type cytochrome [Membranihabitans maritimus]|uniref:c-type cytochrome n=1 Tax=Membranihabitans maritimus TaxID=2904244 RepID=UPI001EFF9809|nr:c-type cytochrome [Membranihabitans maritimus]
MSKVRRILVVVGFPLYMLCFVQCNSNNELLHGDTDNGGLNLPDGFDAIAVVDSIGFARHIAVNTNGDIYVKLTRTLDRNKGNVALRDTDGNGTADSVVYFGDYEAKSTYGATGMRIYNDYLYFGSDYAIYRNKLTPGKLVPESEIEVILTDDYENSVHGYEHIAKAMTFDTEGNMYVPYGAPGDVCRIETRVPGSLGMDPCPELEEHAGIWKFDASKKNQTQKDGVRYATGLRSILALDWNRTNSTLYAVQHGRDGFLNSWPELYDAWDNAMLPAEEFFEIPEGSDAGWPYYYYDQIQGKKILMPEYGGDGKKEGNGKDYLQPLIGFPGHYAPMDMLFYTGDQFPDRYKNGAFIAFHGSNIRAPYPMAGNMICFVPFEKGKPSGPWEIFADGFAGRDTVLSSSEFAYRPMGLAMGPDGSLYVTDSNKGKIWRILFNGDKKQFGAEQLAGMERKRQLLNIKTPDKTKDDFSMGKPAVGENLYNIHCSSCHQKDGKGDGLRFPPIEESEWVSGDKSDLIDIVLNGLQGSIEVKGKKYTGVMPAFNALSDGEIARILSYIRLNFGNTSSAVRTKEVTKVRTGQSTIN